MESVFLPSDSDKLRRKGLKHECNIFDAIVGRDDLNVNAYCRFKP